MGSKKVLVLTYTHSFKHGVGGRRWINYSKELAGAGHQVTVLCAKEEFDPSLKHPAITYHTFRSKYPVVLKTVPGDVWRKLQYRLAIRSQWIHCRGSLYDKAFRDLQTVRGQLEKLYKTGEFDNLIVSGAPFSLLYAGALFKKEHPETCFIGDLRDPWTWGKGYGIENLKGKRKQWELHMEEEAFRMADHILVASKDMANGYTGAVPENCHGKISVLLNGSEPLAHEAKAAPKGNGIVLTHIGSIGQGTEKYWKPFFTRIAQKHRNIKIQLIGNNNKLVENFLMQLGAPNVMLKERMEASALPAALNASSAFLMFKKDGLENSFPSKFFDYVKFPAPIMAFTRPGEVSREIERNAIGMAMGPTTSGEAMDAAISALATGNFPYNKDYPWQKFSVQAQAKTIQDKLI